MTPIGSARPGASYEWNARQRLPPASVIKLPVMVALYRAAAEGLLDLSGPHARRSRPLLYRFQ